MSAALPGLPGSATDPGSGPAETAALDGLLDDGGAARVPLAAALAAHRDLRDGPDQDLVATLVVPAAAAAELATLLGPADLGLRVLLAASGPTALPDLLAARSALIDADLVEVVGLRLPLPAGPDPARAALALLAGLDATVPAWITLPPGVPAAALDVLAGDGAENVAVDLAGTPPAALAALLRDLVDRDLPFRAAGADGLGRGASGVPGALQVLCAVRAALNGAEVPELARILAADDPAGLTSVVRRMSAADAAVTRAFLPAVEVADAPTAVADLRLLGLSPDTFS